MKTSKSIIAAAIAASVSLVVLGCGGGSSSATGPAVTTGRPPASTAPVSPDSSPTPPVAPKTTVTVDSVNGPRSLTVPLATPVGSAYDTLPSNITGEASLALWPMVASINTYTSSEGKLTADRFPTGVWPINFRYTSTTTNDRSDPTNGASSSNFACSLDMVAGALVATINGRTFSAPIDDSPTYTAIDYGNPTTGDGFRVNISPTATASYQPATQRYMHLLVQADNPYVDPSYGPKNAGPSMKIFANYEGFVPGMPAGSTTLIVDVTDTKTGFFTQYGCADQLI